MSSRPPTGMNNEKLGGNLSANFKKLWKTSNVQCAIADPCHHCAECDGLPERDPSRNQFVQGARRG